jgi:hypothetical protein
MAGRIHALIDEIVRKRAKGDTALEHFVRAQLLMKGIDPAKYGPTSDDDPTVLKRLEEMDEAFSSMRGER